jgi:hypothetical protein
MPVTSLVIESAGRRRGRISVTVGRPVSISVAIGIPVPVSEVEPATEKATTAEIIEAAIADEATGTNKPARTAEPA